MQNDIHVKVYVVHLNALSSLIRFASDPSMLNAKAKTHVEVLCCVPFKRRLFPYVFQNHSPEIPVRGRSALQEKVLQDFDKGHLSYLRGS